MESLLSTEAKDETKDFRSLQNIMSFSRRLRSENLDMYVACRLFCMAYIFSELSNPTDEELIVITTATIDAWYRSDSIPIETLVRYLLEKYENKKYSLDQIQTLSSYELIEDCAWSIF